MGMGKGNSAFLFQIKSMTSQRSGGIPGRGFSTWSMATRSLDVIIAPTFPRLQPGAGGSAKAQEREPIQNPSDQRPLLSVIPWAWRRGLFSRRWYSERRRRRPLPPSWSGLFDCSILSIDLTARTRTSG